MRSVAYAVAMALAIGVLMAVTGSLAWRGLALCQPGAELPLHWRLSMWVYNQLVSYGPFSPVFIGLAAIAGAWRTREVTQRQRLQALLVWLGIAVLTELPAFVRALSIGFNPGHGAIPLLMVSFGVGLVAEVAVLVLAVRVVWVWFRSRRA